MLSCVFFEKQILVLCVISERELVGFLCFQREPDFGLWFLLETFVCVCVFSERNRFWFLCVCVFVFFKRNRFCCCVFAVFSKTDFWLCVCFCDFIFFPETDLVEGFLWFSERNRFWVVVVGEILLLGCVVLVLWVFLVLGLLKS